MAIRINAGAVPQAGRLTMPKGTYLPNPLQPLSNPSTSAIGTIAGGQGMNPGTIQPAGTPLGTPVGGNPFLPGGEGEAVWKQATTQPTIWDDLKRVTTEFFTGTGQFGQNPDKFLRSIVNNDTPQGSMLTPPKTQTNSLVGTDVGSSPTFLTGHQLNSMFTGISPKEKAEIMAQRGFTRSYQMGVGEIWVKTGEGTPTKTATSAISGSLDERGRPEFVDPTALEQGERVTNQEGTTFYGGQDYTNPAGETVSQYAMTLPGRDDPKGMYKWVSTVQKDRDGNWVRINRQVLRKVHTRSHRRKQFERKRKADAAKNSGVSNAEVNQLVNLRADYG